MYSKEASLTDLHFISGTPTLPLTCKVRLRHRQELQDVILTEANGNYLLHFKTSQKAITPGQFAVFYQNNVSLGGGVIS